MTTITNGLSVYTANTVAPTPSSGATGAVQATTTAKASPTISLSNSATVSLSGAVVVASNTPVKFAAAIAAFKAATTPEAVAALPIYTIKDASTLLTSSPDARETLMAMAVASGSGDKRRAPTGKGCEFWATFWTGSKGFIRLCR